MSHSPQGCDELDMTEHQTLSLLSMYLDRVEGLRIFFKCSVKMILVKHKNK